MFLLREFGSKGMVNRGYQWPRASLYHGIPIENLEVAKVVLANLYVGSKFRIRYRGSRIANDGRTPTQRQQDCTKATASSFSIYYR